MVLDFCRLWHYSPCCHKFKQEDEDEGNRKYILIEMGEYFDTVLKPRIQKVIYSKDWKDGKPVDREGSSHIFKYIKLESLRIP